MCVVKIAFAWIVTSVALVEGTVVGSVAVAEDLQPSATVGMAKWLDHETSWSGGNGNAVGLVDL